MNKYLGRSWNVITTQPRSPVRPTIHFMWLGQALRLIFADSDALGPVAVETRFGHSMVEFWFGLSVAAPPMALLAWFLATHLAGRARYFGIRLKLLADVGLFTSLLTYHLSVVLTNPSTGSRIPSRYLVGAILLIVLALVLADLREVNRIERRAKQARQDGLVDG